MTDHPIRLGRPPRYPWRTMNIGDTFVMPYPIKQGWKQAWAAHCRTGHSFGCKRISDTETLITRTV